MNPTSQQPEWKEIEHELENTPTPEPPADLLARIQAEIPAAEELVSEPNAAANGSPAAGGPRRRWLMAASVLVALSASFLAYRVRQEPSPPTIGGVGQALAVGEGPVEEVAADADGRDDEMASRELDRSTTAGEFGRSATEPERAAPGLDAPQATRSDRDGAAADAAAFADGREGRSELGKREPASAATAPGRLEVGAEPSTRDTVAPPSDSRSQAAAEVPGSTDELPHRSPEPAARALQRSRTAGTETEEKASGNLPKVAEGMAQGMGVQSLTRPLPAPPAPPSTGGSAEPNDAPYGDVFYRGYGTNPFIDTEDDPLSTFGLDVDSGSYTVARRYLREGHLPPADAIRVEEFVNYFDYRDAPPRRGDFALTTEAAPSLFGGGPRHYLVRFNVAGREVSAANRKPATLVFVVDVSGSMNRENRLGLVKQSLGMLLDELRPDDRVGLVVYGSEARVLLEPTGDLGRIREAIERLQPGGSTNAEDGLTTAYRLISAHRDGPVRQGEAEDDDAVDERSAPRLSAMPRGARIHRVILCSDGVANIGRTGPTSILERIEREAGAGIELTTVGFGMGNYNDVLMEQLADRGDGAYAYVDTLHEARRIFVENLTGTLQTIASDAKVQVEFDPETVSRYRLLGYENRAIADVDFRNDSVDAGEIGAGHTMTALYEIKLHADAPTRGDVAQLNLRYLSKATGRVEETSTRLRLGDLHESWDAAPRALRLASIVAEFAELLRGSYWTEGSSLTELLPRAQRVSAEYAGDADVAELVDLIGKASRLALAR